MKKILFLGLRNKFCIICKHNEGRNETPKHHCYQKWPADRGSLSMDRGSLSMESDTILEGFQNSISLHGLVYKRMIGDGDSCTYFKVMTNVKYQGVIVEKIECVNHAVKRFNTNICKLIDNTADYPLQHCNVFKRNLKRLGTSLRAAITVSTNMPIPIATTNPWL